MILRFALPAMALIAITALVGMPYVERLYTDWFRSDLGVRSQLVVDALGPDLDRLAEAPKSGELRRVVTRARGDQRLLAIKLCKTDGETLYTTENPPSVL
ncbi:MAG: hypothetical protein EOP08_09245, partial [Proteobacteria bacterium]